nr:synaptobrevin, longin-like domain protein [Tanacetum cinerariifolium]
MEITATIDRKVKVVTEAYVRRHLKLEDSGGKFSPQWRFLIHSLLHYLSPKKTSWEQFNSNIATALICLVTNRVFNFSKLIFDGMGKGSTVPVVSLHTPTGSSSTSPPYFSSPPRSSLKQETKVPWPSFPTHTHVADEAASVGVDVRHGGAATTITSLDVGHGSGNIDKTPSIPYDSPLPRVNTLGSYKGKFKDPSKQRRSMIEEISQDTEVTMVTPTQVSTQEEAHSQPEDQLVVLSAAKVLVDAAKVHTYTRRRRTVNTGSDGISTASRIVSTAEESV